MLAIENMIVSDEDDLWFLPDPLAEMGAESPPWPLAETPARPDPADWQAQEHQQARLLADTTEALGRLRERIRFLPPGCRERLALGEITAQLALDGLRLGPERLALYRAGRLPSGDDAMELARANWGLRRITSAGDPLRDPGAFFDRRGSDEFATQAETWRQTVTTFQAHPLTQAGYATALLRSTGLVGDQLLEPIVAALCIGGPDLSLRAAQRTEMGLNGLAPWLEAIQRSVQACLMELARIHTWLDSAHAQLAQQSGATPAKLVDALLKFPTLSVPLAQAETGASKASCQRGLQRLTQLGLTQELTGQARYRFWAAAL